MPSPSNSVISFKAGPIPADMKDWPRFLQDVLDKLNAAVDALAAGHVETTYVPPTKPRAGDWRLADGVKWDPLALAGTNAYWVGYRNGAWSALA